MGTAFSGATAGISAATAALLPTRTMAATLACTSPFMTPPVSIESIPGDDRSAEPVVDPHASDVPGEFRVGLHHGSGNDVRLRHGQVRLATKVIVEIFELRAPVLPECIFEPAADRPAGPSLGRRAGAAKPIQIGAATDAGGYAWESYGRYGRGGGGGGMAVGQAARHVKQRDGSGQDAEATTQRAEPMQIRVLRGGDDRIEQSVRYVQGRPANARV